MDTITNNWFKLAFSLRGSVIHAIWQRVIMTMAFALLVMIAYQRGLPVNQPILTSLIPSIVLGLLLVFRTNTAYERFWEGRRLWDTMVYTARNLARNIWVMVPINSPKDIEAKVTNIRLIGALMIAIKLHLRQETINRELRQLLTDKQYLELKNSTNKPLKITGWLAQYFHNSYQYDNLNNRLFIELNNGVTQILLALGGCERILTTPLPWAYTIHLRHLLILYCFALPFQMVLPLGWWTIPVVGIVSFSLLGVEEIGVEIENPFGHDPNDLRLDNFCDELQRDLEELIVSIEEEAFKQQELNPTIFYTDVKTLES